MWATHRYRSIGSCWLVPLKRFRTTKDGVPVSKLAVRRREQSRWIVELTAGQDPPRNSVGYIGVEFIDDSDQGGRYRVSFFEEGSRETPGFTIALIYLSASGHEEGIPVEIAWNRSLGRFQEYTVNRTQKEFSLKTRTRHIKDSGRNRRRVQTHPALTVN